MINNLIRAKLNKIVNWQDIIKKDIVNYKSKREKTYNFWKYSLPIVFLRNIQEGYLSLEDADNKQSNFDNELNNFDKSIKNLFLSNLRLFFGAREKVLNNFKSRLFPIKNFR